MEISEAVLLTSAPSKKEWPVSELPELVLAGRSNVGKSSFINALCRRKKLAYVGNTPGKTRLLNFFQLNQQFVFVDVPGYGYANISKAQLQRFGDMMEDYFKDRVQKKGVVLLIDARHLPSEDDHLMLDFVRYYNMPLIIIATKTDKVAPTRLAHQLAKIRADLCLQPSEPLFPFSATNPTNKDEIWASMISVLGI